ncbi:hypothetical protein V9K67_13450 [Paraflavisolibacter sp. H34]|uniref:hypothetical protein n=1 Tax=Huijunlia imazamoxiresistens TaxID=3127457 RepID=UPI00301AE813
MDNRITADILEKYRSGRCTEAERRLVETWYASYENRPPLFEDEQSAAALRLRDETKTLLKRLLGDEGPGIK